MPHSNCKVRNCDLLPVTDRITVFHIPNVKVKESLTSNEELMLKRRNAWLKALGYPQDSNRELRDLSLSVCSKHFVSGKPADNKDINNVDWVPTLHLGLNPSSSSSQSDTVDLTLDPEDDKEESDTERRAVKRKMPRLKPSPAVVKAMEISSRLNASLGTIYCETTSCESEHLANKDDLIKRLKAENQQLLSQNSNLKAKLLEAQSLYKSLETEHKISVSKFSDLCLSVHQYTLNEKTFTADEEKVKYLTGLPTYDVLKAMFVHIEHSMGTGQCITLSKFQQYILTLMCVNLNIGFEILAYIFRISTQFVSRIFSQVLQVMYTKYKPLVLWPDREDLLTSVPLLFRESFGQQIVVITDILELSVVIDTIEVTMDSSSRNASGPSTVISDYRNETTIKFLIAMSPQGSVTFISKGCGDNLSEKEMIEKSGLLQNLLPDDFVLCEKGSSVHKVVQPDKHSKGNCTMELRPYRTKLARNLCDHVERLVDSFRKRFKFWSSGVPVEFFKKSSDDPSDVEKMVLVSCALNNVNLTVVF